MIARNTRHVASTGGAEPEYSDKFYDEMALVSRRSAEEIVPVLIDWLHPQSVADVGCGTGAWLAAFQRHGVADIFGIDGPWVRPESLEISLDKFLRSDLVSEVPVSRQFDIVMSLETAEHLPPAAADAFVTLLTSLGSTVVFSAAIPRQGGTLHLNEQWPEYWVERFKQHGYTVIDCLRPLFWSNPRVAWWYSQNMLIFVHDREVATRERLLAATAPPVGSARALVHPAKYEPLFDYLERVRSRPDLKEWSCGELLAVLPYSLTRAIKQRVKAVSAFVKHVVRPEPQRG
jgi:SAM-dependent methyltransferase